MYCEYPAGRVISAAAEQVRYPGFERPRSRDLRRDRQRTRHNRAPHRHRARVPHRRHNTGAAGGGRVQPGGGAGTALWAGVGAEPAAGGGALHVWLLAAAEVISTNTSTPVPCWESVKRADYENL